MAEWKKVIVSGSSAVLSGLTIPEQAAASGDEVLIINTSGVVSSTAASNIAGSVSSIVAGDGIDISDNAGAVTITGETSTATNPGIIEIATDSETNAGSDATRAVTPKNLSAWTGNTAQTSVGTIGTGTWQGTAISTTYLANTSGTNTGDESDASTSVKGIVELATTSETTTGTDTTRAVTPDGLKDGYQGSANVTTLGTIGTGTWQGTAINQTYLSGQSGTNTGDEPDASTSVKGIVELATTSETTTGTDTTRAVTPDGLKDGYQGSANVTTLGTIGTGTWQGSAISTTYLSNTSGTNTGDEPDASATVKGIVELATDSETNAGTDTTRAITPSNLDAFDGNNAIVSVGVLNAGSITSGFGSIDVGDDNITTTGIISGSTIQTAALYVTGSAEMSGDLVFNGVTFSETSVAVVTGSTTTGTSGGTDTHTFHGDVIVTGSVHVSQNVNVDGILEGDQLDINGSADISGALGSGAITSTGLITGADLTITGATTTIGTVTSGVWQGTAINQTYLVGQSGTNTGDEPDASTSVKGIVELATTSETTTGTDTTRAVTPDGLKDGYQGSSNVTTLGTIATGVWNGTEINQTYLTGQSGTNTGDEADASTSVKGIVELATTSETTTGTDTTRAVTPDGLKDGYQGSSNVTTLGTIATGVWNGTEISTTYLANTSGTNTGDESDASTSVKGIVELATTSETTTGTDTTRAVTPDGLKDGYQGSSNVTTLGTIATGVWNGTAINQTYLAGQSGTNTGDEPDASATVKGIVELATDSETNTGTDTTRAITPANLAAWTGAAGVSETELLNALAALNPAGTGNITIGASDADTVVITGNLTVSGTTTTVNTDTLEVDDPFIQLGIGDTGTGNDFGIVFGDDTQTGGNNALYWDGGHGGSQGRMAVSSSVAGATTSIASAAYHLVGAFAGTDTDAATAQCAHVGNIRIESNDIYIYV